MATKKQSSGLIRVFGAILLVGIACVGTYTTYKSTVLTVRGQKSIATCIRVETRVSGTGSNRQTRRIWTVRFITADGTMQEGKIDPGFSGLKEGEQIEVLYDPLDSRNVQANRAMSLWFFPVLSIIGVLIFGRAFFFSKRRRHIRAS